LLGIVLASALSPINGMNKLTHLMAALTALWLIWPETPPESKVRI
jgi:hypothetical protein